MKKLIVCCDGSWNTLEQEHDGVPVPTNVGRLYFALDHTKPEVQIAYYHPGVGTNPSFNDKVFGGAFGDGLDKNIKSAYQWVCSHYEPNDQIFLFGFSRGAYTARSLGGFLTRCGILDTRNLDDKEIWHRVDMAYKQGYRERDEGWLEDGWDRTVAPDQVTINFIGVWDTVGALGIPDTFALLSLVDNLFKLRFHDTELSAQVKVARHALALDEQRASFSPTLWTNIPSVCDVQQIWFPGGHSDVGGGYVQTGLSDGALQWMIDESAKCGLAFNPQKISQIKPNFQDVLHNTYTGYLKFLGSQPRSVPPVNAPDLHQSAKDRHADPAITEKSYMSTLFLNTGGSTDLRVYAIQEWNRTGIYMSAGEIYEFEAAGEWIDDNIKTGPDGSPHEGSGHMGQLIHQGLDLVGKLEGVWQKVTKNQNANLLLTKREEAYPWFALIGVIANGGQPTEGGAPAKHETFMIGNGCRYEVIQSGYFYAFANDAWHFYENNRGSVSLRVRRAS